MLVRSGSDKTIPVCVMCVLMRDEAAVMRPHALTKKIVKNTLSKSLMLCSSPD